MRTAYIEVSIGDGYKYAVKDGDTKEVLATASNEADAMVILAGVMEERHED